MSTRAVAVHRPHPRHAATGMPVLLRQRQWWVLLCLITLLGFQSLGLVHRTLHGGGVAPKVALAVGAHGGTSRAASPEAPAFKAPSLGHLPGSTDCQLLDELSTALGPITQALAWTALLPDHPVATPVPLSAPVVQTWRAPARAPPLA